MTKADLVLQVSVHAQMHPTQANKVVSVMIDAIFQALTQGEKVSLPCIGSLQIVERQPRRGRNPQTGEVVEVPARKAIKFNAARAMKDAVNVPARA